MRFGCGVMKRPRSTACPSVGINEYKTALRSGRSKNLGSFEMVLGPVLAEDLRGVSPHAVVKLATLFHDLTTSGLANAVA